MSLQKSREIHLRRRPVGMPSVEDFELAAIDLPPLAEGELRVRNQWLSVDPYMRGRMYERESYVPPFALGRAMEGGAIGVVEESRNPGFTPGQHVLSMHGWREGFISNGMGLTPIDPAIAPPQAFLGALGMPGLTAYAGLLRVGQPKEGETVFVSAAAGAVGSIVVQIAKAKGCKVVGSAGDDDKCEWVRSLGADAMINYKKEANLTKALAAAAPKGIDIYFDNVGGPHLEAALHVIRPFGRIPVCGMISGYNDTAPAPGPANLIMVIPKRLRIEGFIVSDHYDLMPDFLRDMGAWIAAGKLSWRETVFEGIDKTPEAFLSLFTGANSGKMLVKLT